MLLAGLVAVASAGLAYISCVRGFYASAPETYMRTS